MSEQQRAGCQLYCQVEAQCHKVLLCPSKSLYVVTLLETNSTDRGTDRTWYRLRCRRTKDVGISFHKGRVVDDRMVWQGVFAELRLDDPAVSLGRDPR